MSEAYDEMDEYLDGLGLEKPEPEPDEGEEAQPLAAEAETPEADEPDPSQPRGVEVEREEPEPVEAKDETPADEPEEPAAEAVETEPAKGDDDSPDALRARAEAAEKMAAARLAELSRVRQKNAELSRATAQTVAPKPTTEDPAAAAGDDGTRVPVQVDAEGNQVYMDLSDPKVRDFVRREAAAANAPTPEQRTEMARIQTVQKFVAENPDTNRQAAEDMMMADQFIGEALKAALVEYGAQPQSIDELMAFSDQVGVTAKVQELYPQIAPHMRNFVAAVNSENTDFLSVVMHQIGQGYAPAAAPAPRPSPPLRSVENAPKSLAKTGGDRVISTDADNEREFDGLDKRYTNDPINGITNEEHARWRELGVKLGKPGFDGI